MNKWMIIPALAGAVVLGGAALANGLGTSEAHAAESFLSLKEAKALAVQKVGGKVTEIELEKTKTGFIYEVEVKSNGVEYDLDIDAQTGKVVIEKQQAKKVAQAELPRVADAKLLTKDQAIAIAQKKAKGSVTKAELDDDDGRKHYDIEIKDGAYEYDFEIDAITGKILEFEKDRDDDDRLAARNTKTVSNSTKAVNTKPTMLTKNQAIVIAMKQAKGTVTEIELDDDDGRKIYEIEIEDGTYEYEFDIDAFSGKVLKFEKDRDDDNDNDDQDDYDDDNNDDD
ncbi:PepSY domain-containing protein [Sporosarcina sp. FSL K6-2383]|uniref:PepSY domain-containing protein n=1 Tax=Sporosarcina sp. FSL K6-2383 TaxID=2921556 RepID=UPI00315AF222